MQLHAAAAKHNVSTGDNTLTGLGLRVHFNSSQASWIGNDVVFGSDLIACDAAAQNDSGNFDGDASTDKYVGCAWASLGGTWPNRPLPLNHLMDVRFQFAAGMGTGSTTTVRYSASSTASGYSFFSLPTTLRVGVACNLDVDGNGTVAALEDGLLTMRYEFASEGPP